MKAQIGIEETIQGDIIVRRASLWDDNMDRDFPGVLEGMLKGRYKNKKEIKWAIEQILEDNDAKDTSVTVEYYKF